MKTCPLVANKRKKRKEIEGSLARCEKRKEDSMGRRGSSLSLYKLQIPRGKPLGNLLISFNAIFRKIYGSALCGAFRRQGRRAEQMTPRGMNFRGTNEGCWYTLVWGVRDLRVVRRRMIACLRRRFAKRRAPHT